jgi:hypothetical protein
VIDFLEAEPEVGRMRDDIAASSPPGCPAYIRDNRSYLTVAIGCTGGQHRSVYIAEWLAANSATRPACWSATARWPAVMHWLALIRPGDWLVMLAGARCWSASASRFWQGGMADRAIIRQEGKVFAEVDLRAAAISKCRPAGHHTDRRRTGPRPRRRRPRAAPVLRSPGLADAPRRNRHLRPQSRQRADRRADQGL